MLSKQHVSSHLDRFVWLAAVFLLIALECIPFWIYQNFPSQDGPSHLYNAVVLDDYGKEPIYSGYYSIHFPIAGNVATQLVFLGLLKALPSPPLAEKLFLTAYAILLPFCLRYLLGCVTSQANVFSLFAFLLIPNLFLHMGFWNFCVSIPIALFALGYYIRHKDAWNFRSIAILFGLGAVLYLTHMVAWAVFAIAIVACELRDKLTAPGRLIRSLWRAAPVLSTLIPPGVLSLLFILSAHGPAPAPGVSEPLRVRAWTVYSLYFLHTISASDMVIMKTIVALFGLLIAAALTFRFRKAAFFKPTDIFIALSGILGCLALFGPDAVGDGSYIRARVAFFAFIFLIIWLAAQPWPKWIPAALWVVLPAMAALSLIARLPAYRRWNGALRDFKSMADRIRPGATVFSLMTQDAGLPIDPFAHAVDLFTPRPFIDLLNYEAGTDQFMTYFRRDHSPFDALGKLAEIERVPPIFDIARYETRTLGCVDYVLLYTLPKFEQIKEGPDDRVKLPGYRLIYSTEKQFKAQLYAREKTYPGNCK
jgi:hypothetical protein